MKKTNNNRMNRIELQTDKQFHINLNWNTDLDMDLALFYQTNNNKAGGVFSMEYTNKKESEGCLDHLPYIKYMHNGSESEMLGCIEQILVSSLQDMQLINICAINYSAAIDGDKTDFSTYGGRLDFVNKGKCFHSILMNNHKTGDIYVFCRIISIDGRFWLEDRNDVLTLQEAYETIPGFSKICN